jgi:hypothetical protein
MTLTDRLPPHDIEAEEAVIASVMVDPEAWASVCGIVTQWDFFREKNGWIFQACADLTADGISLNQVTVGHLLARKDQLEEVGGNAYLSKLTTDLATPVGVEHYAQIVRKDALYRSAIIRAQNVISAAYRAKGNLTELLDDWQRAGEELRVEATGLLGGNGKSFRFWTGAEIAAAVPVEIDWQVKPYLVRGAATELSGHIKHGKTTFCGHLCRAVLDGAPFLGEPTAKGPVLYITEQPPASFRQLIEAAGLERDDFHVLYWLDTLGQPWPKVAEAAVAKALEMGAVLLVVDTLSQLAGLKGEEENHAGAAQEALQPLQEAAVKGIAVLALRQDRKSGGEVGDSGRGSGAFGGGFDILVALKRPPGQPRETIRTLESISRFGHVPASLVIELTPGGYVSLGSAAAVAEAEAEEAILEALGSDENTALPFSTKEEGKPSIRPLLSEHISEPTARRVLKKLVDLGKLNKKGRGVANDPQRYWRRERTADDA